MSRIIVLGSGAWGTALALSLHRRGGHQVTLWAHSPEFAQQINDAGENTLFFPGFPIPTAITVTGDNAAVADAEIILSVVPSEFLRSTFARLGPLLRPGQIVVSATKGVENHTFLRMTQVIASCMAESCPTRAASNLPIGALSGPSFALKSDSQGRGLALCDFEGEAGTGKRANGEVACGSRRAGLSHARGDDLGHAQEGMVLNAFGSADDDLAGVKMRAESGKC